MEKLYKISSSFYRVCFWLCLYSHLLLVWICIYAFTGAPEPPSPQIAVINSTTISVTWNKPFSQTPSFDILRYTLNIHNGTSSSIVLTKVFDASGIDSYPVQYLYISPSISHSDCHNLSMEVTASNSVGISEAGVAVGGFPIGKCMGLNHRQVGMNG